MKQTDQDPTPLTVTVDEQAAETPTDRKSNFGKMMFDLMLCILIPTLILKYLSEPEMLGSKYALIVALTLPIFVALQEFFTKKKIGFIPALGFISILLTGGIALLKLPTEYIAIKEAMIPGVIAIATIISSYTKYPLIRTFLYNDLVMDTKKIADHLHTSNTQLEFDNMMIKATWMLASSFVLSAILNYILAKWIIVSPTGSPAFNDELGTLTLMSYPVIVLPCMVITFFALFYVIRNISKLTGLKLEDMVHQ